MSMRIWVVSFMLLLGYDKGRLNIKKLAIFFTNLRKLSSPPLEGDKLNDKYPENTEKTKRQRVRLEMYGVIRERILSIRSRDGPYI